MSKRKSAVVSKRPRRQTIAVRAQRNKQAIVRSPKDRLSSVAPLRSDVAGSTETPLKLPEEPKEKDPIVEKRVADLIAAALHDGGGQTARVNNPKKEFDYSSATTGVPAYPASLLEMTQANIEFTLEFSRRLATIRSPFEVFEVMAEFARRWIDLFGKNSKELAGYPFWGIAVSRELTALPRR